MIIAGPSLTIRDLQHVICEKAIYRHYLRAIPGIVDYIDA